MQKLPSKKCHEKHGVLLQCDTFEHNTNTSMRGLP